MAGLGFQYGGGRKSFSFCLLPHHHALCHVRVILCHLLLILSRFLAVLCCYHTCFTSDNCPKSIRLFPHFGGTMFARRGTNVLCNCPIQKFFIAARLQKKQTGT